MTVRWQLACLDMAGTTVHDGGLVETAFVAAMESAGVENYTPEFARMMAVVRRTMGHSKIAVFRELLGDETLAQQANQHFEQAYGDLIGTGAVNAIPGAEHAISVLRGAGVKVALTTGFSRTTQDALLKVLGWESIADLTLCPADVGRGRPYPDLVLGAVMRLGVEDVRQVAVAGDTPSDILTGLRSGAGIVAGVLTGAGTRTALKEAGATHLLGSIGELPHLLDIA